MKNIAIIGLGFSGLSIARELLINYPNSNITAFDANNSHGKGAAYSTNQKYHLLNIPASNMSLYADKIDHFILWLIKYQKMSPDTDFANYFARRSGYGLYLEQQLDDLLLTYKSRFQIINQYVTSCQKKMHSNYQITTNIATYTFDIVILALGNTVNDNFNQMIEHSHLINNTWEYNQPTINKLMNSKQILIIGNGLTMVDWILSLFNNGYSGQIHTISRHGLLPNPQPIYTDIRYNDYIKNWLIKNPKITINELANLIRKEIKLTASNGVDWQIVIDAIHPYTQMLWQNLTVPDQKRFLRHLRFYWDNARHRIAPQIYKSFNHLINTNKLICLKGRVTKLIKQNSAIKIIYSNSKHTSQEIVVDYVINASGLSTKLTSYGTLFKQMLADGIITEANNNLGLNLNSECQVLNQENLFAVGPLTRVKLWENTAVPDIRQQTKRLAQYIANLG